mmetsp:Transcript_96540/g.311305  ORF Transcript_96540/g.311305 Transcript_96540/m.311305 type:complete len:133 (+) Transcript_96540:115-513(+)
MASARKMCEASAGRKWPGHCWPSELIFVIPSLMLLLLVDLRFLSTVPLHFLVLFIIEGNFDFGLAPSQRLEGVARGRPHAAAVEEQLAHLRLGVLLQSASWFGEAALKESKRPELKSTTAPRRPQKEACAGE